MTQTKVQKVMVAPINFVFKLLQQRTLVSIWLQDNKSVTIEGRIIGFDEFMNLVLEDAAEVNENKGVRKKIGEVLLKGENILFMGYAQQ